MNTRGKWIAGIGGATVAGLVTWWLLPSNDRKIKDTPPDALPQAPELGKTGYKRIDAILGALRAAAQASGIPLGLLIGWIAKESGGKLADTTNLDERGYFQLMPAESKSIGVDHQRLSTDSDYSIDAGVKLIRHYQSAVNDLNVAPAGSSYYWRLVKLAHSMGSGQVKKVVKAAQAAGQAGSWDDLATFALGMKINGPQPTKWFPFVDDSREHTKNSSVYRIGAPFGFGSGTEAVVGFKTSLGVSRLEMPQIKSADVSEFIDGLKKKGIRVDVKNQRVGDLKPTQNTLNLDKIKALADQGDVNEPIIVSSDLYILDGHHRWGGLYVQDQNQQISTYTVGLPIRVLLKAAREFSKAFYKGDEHAEPSVAKQVTDWLSSPKLIGLDVFAIRRVS